MRLHLAAALAAGAVFLPAAAPARTLRIPEGDPAVTLEVPDDWSVTPADGGLQIVSPDHTSIVLAGMAKADRAGLATWQRSAGRRMVDFGITFDAKAIDPKTTPLRDARAAVESDPITPVMGPTVEATAKAGELAPLSSVPSMALLGRASDLSVADLEAGGTGPAGPAIAGIGAAKPPAAGKASEGKASEGKTGDSKAGPDGVAADKAAAADKAGKPLHFASVVIHGASLGGKPVDVQFLNFGYSKERWFLMQQESSPDDDRAGAIVKSVRAVR